MQQDVVLRGRRIVLRVAPAPVVADGVGKNGAVVVVRRRRDGLAALLHRLQPLLRVLVQHMQVLGDRNVQSVDACRSHTGVSM